MPDRAPGPRTPTGYAVAPPGRVPGRGTRGVRPPGPARPHTLRSSRHRPRAAHHRPRPRTPGQVIDR
ncbi:hypothetical protein [Ornithinimicrobium kibberense]|uniref:hypothetical protein n=1 Tax=Ornithinimicrobium kibberense TaxID=282060 RepID=UPI00360EDCC2